MPCLCHVTLGSGDLLGALLHGLHVSGLSSVCVGMVCLSSFNERKKWEWRSSWKLVEFLNVVQANGLRIYLF